MNSVRKEYTFLWYIENFSCCWHKNGEPLVSPEFIVDEQEGTAWILLLYPRGHSDDWTGCNSLFLAKGNNAVTSENVSFRYELSILAADGSFLSSDQDKDESQRNKGWIFVQMDEVHLQRKPEYTPDDTLTVSCKMWIGQGIIQKIGRSSARTRIGVEKISFLHTIEDYRTLETNQKKTFQIRSPSKNGCVIPCSVYISDGFCCEEKMIMEIAPSSPHQILTTCEISISEASGKITKCAEVDNRFDSTINNITKLPLCTFTEEMDDESRHLPDHKLSFLCECTFSTGLESQKIEEIVYEMPMETMKHITDRDAEKLSACPNALDDLKAIYNDQFLTDVELKTKTKSFPAHKIVLCARSPVFKAMMSNDMKEKNTECIEINDLDDDIVHQLLLFLYSDNLEDLQWETATKLYYAADKYQIEKLKVICSYFLEDDLSTSNATELLLLADTHNDSDLKEVVEAFILENDEQVFGLDEWEQLIKANPQLAVETMHLKYKKKSR